MTQSQRWDDSFAPGDGACGMAEALKNEQGAPKVLQNAATLPERCKIDYKCAKKVM